MSNAPARINAKQTALVALYVAACFSLIAIVHLELSTKLHSLIPWLLTALLSALVCTSIFSVRFPGFRVRIFSPQNRDITNESKARLAVIWGAVWRLIVCYIPGSIVFGLGGAMIVVFMTKFPILMSGSWLIYPVSFVCFFAGHFLVLYPTLFWWLRLFGAKRYIGITNSRIAPAPTPLT